MSRQIFTRRNFLHLAGATSLAGMFSPSHGAEAVLTEDGLHYQPWFLDSFLEIGDDIVTAADQGRHFAVMWELKGCPYCRETHNVNFAKPEIVDFITSNFDVVQMNVIGSRIVTDIDGEELTEKDMAGKYGVRFTPTIQFFPKSVEGLSDKKPRDREVARMPGYMKPDHFLTMFRYVAEDAYENEGFKSYLKKSMGS